MPHRSPAARGRRGPTGEEWARPAGGRLFLCSMRGRCGPIPGRGALLLCRQQGGGGLRQKNTLRAPHTISGPNHTTTRGAGLLEPRATDSVRGTRTALLGGCPASAVRVQLHGLTSRSRPT